MLKKFLAVSVSAAAIVAVIPTDASAQEVAKPYDNVVFEKFGTSAYQIAVKNIKAPFVFKFSDGTNAFFTNLGDKKDLSYPLDIYSAKELYVQLLSPDQETVYDSFLFNAETKEYIADYNIENFDYEKAGAPDHYAKIPFSLGEVKLVANNMNEITFKEIKKAVMLYDFEKHQTITLPPSAEEITYRIPSEIYLMIDPETLEEVGEFHLNKLDGYTLNPPIGQTYYFVDYKRRADKPDATFPSITPVKPKVVKPIIVEENTTSSYFTKTPAQIATEKFVDISKTDLKDVKSSSHRDAIVLLNKLGIINGYSDGTYKPAKTLRYSDIIKLTGRFAQVPKLEAKQITANMQSTFNTKDVEIISYMQQLDGVYGTNISYNKDVTRGEFAVILANLIQYLANQQTSSSVDLNAFIEQQGFTSNYVVKNIKYKDAVTVLHYFGITSIENGQFNDDKTLNRAQLASFLTRIYAINFKHLQ